MTDDGRPPGGRPSVRTAALWAAIETALGEERVRLGRSLEVVDLGGGTGGLAVRIAASGHRVTVVDPSPDALAALERRAADAGVAVRAVQGDTDGLAGIVGTDATDALLCHGVLELVASPSHALTKVRPVLRPGALLSVVAAQRAGAVLSRALAGHFSDASSLLAGDPGDVRRFDRRELVDLLTGHGFSVRTVHGVRVVVDHVPAAAADLQPGSRNALRDLEAAVAAHPDFIGVASQLHVLASRTADQRDAL
jgi:2-polyprenyl-3-methyl-5-hydroxy-6-metoxy-1,4-benzoquinol methylase